MSLAIFIFSLDVTNGEQNNHVVELGSFSAIADGAQVIANDCKIFGYNNGWVVSGQRFHDNKINVIVRGGESNC
jgi:hypothetical protein